MKIAKREQKILLCLLGILIGVGVYYLYFSNAQEEIASMQSEVKDLQAQIRQLEKYDRDKETYKKRTDDAYAKIQKIIDEFPAEIKEETTVMYAKELENGMDINVSSISMSPPVLLSQFGVGERQKLLYNSEVNFSFTGNYDNVKAMIQNIQTYDEKRNISAFTASYDTQTGNLVGTVTLNLFALAGKGQIYNDPDTGIVQHGTLNPFGGGQ